MRFTKTNAEKFVRTSDDAQVAQFGHLNYLSNLMSSFTGGTSTETNGIIGTLKVLSGTITPAQWKTLNSAPIDIYTGTATTNFLPIGGLIYYSYDGVPSSLPCETFGIYYQISAPALLIDSGSWALAPTSGIIQFVPSVSSSPSAQFRDTLYLGSGANPDCPGTKMDTSTYFIVGLEITI